MAEGEITKEAPVPTNVPPQLPEYHVQTAPVPSEPPATVKVVDPLQIGLGLAEALPGAVELVFTVTVTDTQAVVLHAPTAFT